MKNKKQASLATIIVLVVAVALFALCSCGGQKPVREIVEFPQMEIRFDDGPFEFGVSIDEARAAFPFLKNVELDDADEIGLNLRKTVIFNNLVWNMKLQFDDDELVRIMFTLDTNEEYFTEYEGYSEDLFAAPLAVSTEALKTIILSEYGEPDYSTQTGNNILSYWYFDDYSFNVCYSESFFIFTYEAKK